MARTRYLVSEMGLAAIRGFQGTTLPLAPDKVFVTLKHMTGHGQPESGTNVGPGAHFGERTLRENFFPPFERAVTELPVRVGDGRPTTRSTACRATPTAGCSTTCCARNGASRAPCVSDYFAIRELVTRHRMFGDLKDAGGARRSMPASIRKRRTARPISTCPSWSARAACRGSRSTPPCAASCA